MKEILKYFMVRVRDEDVTFSSTCGYSGFSYDKNSEKYNTAKQFALENQDLFKKFTTDKYFKT